MAETKANEANVTTQGDHDRVAMLSLKVDGTPDQTSPEIVGDEEWAKEAAKRQFAEQAVSAADQARAAEKAAAESGDAEGATQDPSIEAAKKEHDKVAAAAEKAAEKAVDALKK